jgi:Uma2 family endonuclease
MSDMAVEFTSRIFTVDEYHRMITAGIVRARERVELLDGLIVTMPPLGIPHWTRPYQVVAYLSAILAGRAQVHGQISLPLGERSEPEPDIAGLADLPFATLNRVPAAAEIFAMVELAESSLWKDTHAKRRLYASFSIADLLVVDLTSNVLLTSTIRAKATIRNLAPWACGTFVLAATLVSRCKRIRFSGRSEQCGPISLKRRRPQACRCRRNSRNAFTSI